MSLFSTWCYSAYIHNAFDSVSVAAVCSVVFIKVLGKEPNPEEVKKTILVLGLKNVAWSFTWSMCVFALLGFSHNPKCGFGWMDPVPVQSVFRAALPGRAQGSAELTRGLWRESGPVRCLEQRAQLGRVATRGLECWVLWEAREVAPHVPPVADTCPLHGHAKHRPLISHFSLVYVHISVVVSTWRPTPDGFTFHTIGNFYSCD